MNYTISHVSVRVSYAEILDAKPVPTNLDANTYDWTGSCLAQKLTRGGTNLTSGIYAVTVKNSLGCTVSYSISVTSLPINSFHLPLIRQRGIKWVHRGITLVEALHRIL